MEGKGDGCGADCLAECGVISETCMACYCSKISLSGRHDKTGRLRGWEEAEQVSVMKAGCTT